MSHSRLLVGILALGLGLSGLTACARKDEAVKVTDIADAPLPTEVVQVWPGQPPGTADWKLVESVRNNGNIRNVATPTMMVFRPEPGKASGAAVILLPGGGFSDLTWRGEGPPVARWLAERGVTVFLLKYRVKDPELTLLVPMMIAISRPVTVERFEPLMKALDPKRLIAQADAEQALRTVRASAALYGVDPDRVGMMGFSAGGIVTMGAALNPDPAARPSFVASVYGAMFDEMTLKDPPPAFIVHSQDDRIIPVGKAQEIADAWLAVGAPVELHIYPDGVHGYGLGAPGTEAAAWPVAFERWLKQQGLL